MQINLIELAAKQAQWLSVRQATIAGNIANVNTPGYRAMKVEPFDKVLDGSRVAMRLTQNSHMVDDARVEDIAVREDVDAPVVMPSGNSVVLENELMQAGDVRRAFELNTAIVRAFHRMTALVSKG